VLLGSSVGYLGVVNLGLTIKLYIENKVTKISKMNLCNKNNFLKKGEKK